MGFQQFKEDYIKTTVPESRVEMLKSITNLIDRNKLSFIATLYKNKSNHHR